MVSTTPNISSQLIYMYSSHFTYKFDHFVTNLFNHTTMTMKRVAQIQVTIHEKIRPNFCYSNSGFFFNTIKIAHFNHHLLRAPPAAAPAYCPPYYPPQHYDVGWCAL
eukprot:TRINITY_DN21003_c0_g2_i2.p2 TRINITY_DN21003_c0_g2~~TRINITY_DN21003_c0_g2_i2.p2  ORF type:complete len:107 (+),score=3.79 TRINITY_DN21003_c0_g2_i2:166-486(+)